MDGLSINVAILYLRDTLPLHVSTVCLWLVCYDKQEGRIGRGGWIVGSLAIVWLGRMLLIKPAERGEEEEQQQQ